MKKRKKLVVTTAVSILIVLSFLFVQNGSTLIHFLPIPIRNLIPLYTRHAYSSINEALNNEGYSNYSAFSIPDKGSNNSEYLNPKTNNKLELDTSEGGGDVCCEAPTFYVWVDNKDNIFWIRTYQASFHTTNDHWYGPFKLESSE